MGRERKRCGALLVGIFQSDHHDHVHRHGAYTKKLESAVRWRIDFPKAARERCEECKLERESNEMCPGCPFRLAPALTSEEHEIIEIFNQVTSPFVLACPSAFEFALAAYKPSMTTLEARRLLFAFNQIQSTFFEHDQKKLNQQQEKNGR